MVFDRERRADYQLTMTCADYGTPALTSHAIVHVRITDENDGTPTFDREVYQATVAENNRVGVSILQVITITDNELRV